MKKQKILKFEEALEILDIANEYGVKWYRAGKLSKKGHPHHPLYLKADSKLEEYDVEEYLERL